MMESGHFPLNRALPWITARGIGIGCCSSIGTFSRMRSGRVRTRTGRSTISSPKAAGVPGMLAL